MSARTCRLFIAAPSFSQETIGFDDHDYPETIFVILFIPIKLRLIQLSPLYLFFALINYRKVLYSYRSLEISTELVSSARNID